ncbi:uncharacterized protein LOC142328711 isoform X2 [Lycorma delicatula]
MQSEGGKQIGDALKQSAGSDLLTGLGSLFSGRQQGGSGLDPQLVGKVLEMFTGSREQNDEGGAMEGLLNLLPLLANTGHMHHDDPELENEEEHRRHQQATSMFPPFLTNLWEHFITSELGRTLWTNSGLGTTLQLFQDREGNFQMDRIFQSLENNTFRRRWVRSLTGFVAEWIKHVADPATLKRYMSTAQFVGNGFLKAQGYSKAVLFDPSRPAESLSLMVNAVFKRNFGLKINSATYIKPAVAYIQEVFQLGQSKGLSLSFLSSKDIESKLSETVNNEIIEPVLRVWRAYRYAIRVPQCDRYLICTLNQYQPGTEGPAGLKPGITKLASLISSWFLSGHTGTPFWKLYNAAVEEHKCQVKYPVDCSQFHEEDIKATTEYMHNEL